MSLTHVGLALTVYFAVVFALSALPTIEVRSRWVQLLRIALPSWRFFEALGDVPVLRYRSGHDEASLGEWQPALQPLPRSLRRLVLNADGNLALACESLLQQLLADLSELDESQANALEEAVSYRLTRNLVETRVRSDGGRYYQFKLEVGAAGEAMAQEALVSPVYAW